MKVKHVYDVKPIPEGKPSKYHVVTDGLVVSTHRTREAAFKAAGSKPFHKVFIQTSTLYQGQRPWLYEVTK